ncbi:MAG: metal ABC transporter solute-binding protein, Zn/Mn family [Parashewanella sp.]
MRINSKIIALGFTLFAGILPAKAALNIFACEPEYASLVKEIAPAAKVYSATTALQDPHLVQARPSLIAKMRRADLAICAGADLEIGWLPMLQMKSANSKVRNTETGLFFAADQIETLDKLERVDRSMGDVHAKGNPHVHLDPMRLLTIAQKLTQRLVSIDSSNASVYRNNFTKFKSRWLTAMEQWQQQAKPLKGKNVIAYHTSFRYLFQWIGMHQVGDLEPKPGLPPTTGHLVKLLNLAKKEQISAVVVASYQDTRGGEWLASRSSIPMIVLPISVGGNDMSNDLFSLYQSIIDQLIGAIK